MKWVYAVGVIYFGGYVQKAAGFLFTDFTKESFYFGAAMVLYGCSVHWFLSRLKGEVDH
jgi:hypothetical protein